MKKNHTKPEFTIISQNRSNAKFFVASFENIQGEDTSTTSSTYNSGQEINM